MEKKRYCSKIIMDSEKTSCKWPPTIANGEQPNVLELAKVEVTPADNW